MSRFAANPVLAQLSLADSAFDPQPSYDFDDAHCGPETAYNQLHNSHAGMGAYAGQHNPYGAAANNFCLTESSDMLSSLDNRFAATNDMWSETTTLGERHPNNSMPSGTATKHPLFQSDIIKARSDRVSETHGNLTPPEDDFMMGMSKGASPRDRTTNLGLEPGQAKDRSERARNAAIQRHAKSKRKTSRDDQLSETDSEDSGDGTGDKREKYREKNRAAAAKCRAKKKTHVERIEQDARMLETENAILKARVRDLRNQQSELRDMALQHNRSVGGCHCTTLHQYNMSKAAEITSSLNAFAGVRSVASPSQDALGSASDPSRSAEMDHRNHGISMSNRDSFVMQQHPQGPSTSSNIAFASVTTPDSMQMSLMSAVDDDDSSFSNFVRGGSGGRGRYE